MLSLHDKKIRKLIMQIRELELFTNNQKNTKDFKVLECYDEALNYSLDFDNWIKLKNNMFDDAFKGNKDTLEAFDILFNELEEEVNKALEVAAIDNDCEQIQKDIQHDLTLCILAMKKKASKNDFFGEMFDVYVNGLWPCGYEGCYPDGKFIVYGSNDKKKSV